jgi:predicted dehydrogenase
MIDKKINVALLSFAHYAHAESYANQLQSFNDVEVVAIYDSSIDRADKYAKLFKVPKTSSDIDEIISIRELDAVVVCSPTNEHVGLVVKAAQAGKHVFCEKPIATTLKDAKTMINACERAKVIFQMAFPCRFMPIMIESKKILASTELGNVHGLVGGNRGIPPLPEEGGYPKWITDAEQAGGGALMDHSVHVTDAMRFLLNTEVDTVYAEGDTLFSQDLEVDDCGFILIKFKNGAIASVDPSWIFQRNNPYHYDYYMNILQENGVIMLDDRKQAIKVVRQHPEQDVVFEGFGVNVDREMLRKFIDSINAGKHLENCATGEDGLKALEIALAAYKSIEIGQPVSLPLDG